MLTGQYIRSELSQKLLSAERFTPFPKAEQREPWETLPSELRQRMIGIGEHYLNFTWPGLPAVRYMDFVKNGNRSRYERLYFDRRFAVGTLTIAECIENKGRFLDDLINGLWLLCEETSWVVPAHNTLDNSALLPDVSRPTIDLFAAETGALLSWMSFLLQSALDQVTPLICQRIRHEVQRRIIDLYLALDDFPWMGLAHNRPVNNWNPWCNSNCLTAFLLLEDDAERRTQGVVKCLKSLDRFLDGYHDDGGCDEGTSYWGVAGGSLFDCLELLRLATDGGIDVYNEPLIQNIGRYLYRAHIADDYFINFADGNAKVKIYSDLVQRYGHRIGDEKLVNLGIAAFQAHPDHLLTSSGWFPMFRILPHLLNYAELQGASVPTPYVRDVWLDGIQVMAAREQHGSARGLYLAAKGGHNDESHNHNDVGHFIVYANGEPVLIDAGVGEYTRKTFNSERYTIWTMQSAYHNLPTVRGIQQGVGKDFAAPDARYQADEHLVKFSLNLAKAYPPEAGVERWIRTYRFTRNGQASIEICDDFSLNSATDDIILSLLTCCKYEVHTPGIILFHSRSGQQVRLKYDAIALDISSERITIDDRRLGSVWGDHLFRIVFTAKHATAQSTWSMNIMQALW